MDLLYTYLLGKMVNGGSGGDVEGSDIKSTGESAGKVLMSDGEGGVVWSNESGMQNPMTTEGDIIVGGSSGTPTRLGSSYLKILTTSNSSEIFWTNPTLASYITHPSGNHYKVPYANSNGTNQSWEFGKPGLNIGLGCLTTAPSADNTDGLKIVVLPSESGVTKYNGYLYIFLS